MDKIPELSNLKKCKKKAEDKNDLKELGSICNAIGELLSQYGYHEEAIAEHKMEKQLSEALQDKIGEAVACRKLGECYCKLGSFDKALKLQNQYLALAQDCNDKVEIQRALATLGDTYYTQADAQGAASSHHLLNQAEKKFLQALHVCSELRSSSTLTEPEFMAMKGRLLLNLGLVYDVRGAEKESTEYLQKALAIAKQWHLEEEEYFCHFNSATQSLRNGQPQLAQQSLQQALNITVRLNNLPRQKEVYCQLAIVSVNTGKMRLAKHYLKKAYKIVPVAEESSKLIKLYKAVNTVERLEDQLSACEQDRGDLFSVHEKLGDAFTDIGAYSGSYTTAIQHYKQMVECGERLGLGADKLIPAYVSLAQTYADNRQLDLAISNYHKELQLRGEDHEQVCRTWLNIAELEERRGDGYKALSNTYMSAFTSAKKANHSKLQVQVLRSLIAVQSLFKEQRHREQTEAKLKQVQVKYGLKTDNSLSDEEEDSQPLEENAADDSDEEDNLSIADLTDSDKSDEENVRPVLQPVGSTRVRRHKTFKKNEKGETPLHVACINGNLSRVKSLLAEGHPVNERDHCGWTPLHEAANHDFPAVVELLLDAGANINDRGGEKCGGLTPLIDAAGNGNFDVIKVLVKRGANLLAKDDQGHTAAQVLSKWYSEYADTTDKELVSQYNSILRLLQGKAPGTVSGSKVAKDVIHSSNPQAGPSSSTAHASIVSTQHWNTTEAHDCSARSVSKVSHERSQKAAKQLQQQSGIVSSDDDEEEVYHNPQLEELTFSSQTATETYRNSIRALGSSTQRAAVAKPSVTSSRTKNNSPRPALIEEQEMVGDDWLVDDLKPSSRKRRDRSSIGSMLSSDSVRPAREQKRARLSTKQKHLAADSDSSDAAVEGTSAERCSDELERDRRNPSERDRRNPSPLKHTVTNRVYHVESSDSDCGNVSESTLPVLSHYSRREQTGRRQTEGTLGAEHLTVEEGLHRVTDSENAQEDRTIVSHLNTSGQHGPSGSASAVSPRLARVKVKIEGSVFLIPLPAIEEKTVGWLSEEASQRYSSHFGRRPFLTLSSMDGAILSTDDMLSSVLSHDEQVNGTVYGWDQPSLSDRYTQACKTLNTVKYKNILGLLKEAEVSHKLCLSGLGLRNAVLLPITRALRGQTSLTHLHLPDNHLGDSGLQGLGPALADLRSLIQLNLSGNAITAAGLKHLADVFTPVVEGDPSALPLQALELLDLSHNPLGSSIGDSVCSIVRGLPSLTSLDMSSCYLTAALFQHNRPALASCLQGSSIQQLNVSHNNLGMLGVELLLRSVNAQKLIDLDLGHTCQDSYPGHLALHLTLFIKQGCALQRLSLENCCLHHDDAEFLCRLPVELSNLQKLTVSVNKAVTTDHLQRLLHNSAHCAHSQLKFLEAEACSILSPLVLTSSSPSHPTVLQALKDKLSSACPLQHLAFTCRGLDKAEKESLSEVWMQHWPQARVNYCGESALFSLKQT